MIKQTIAKVRAYGHAAEAVIDASQCLVGSVKVNGVALDKLKSKP